MDWGNTVDAAEEFLQLYNELRLAKRALFRRELAYRDQPLGSVYPPQEHTNWQKECGEYKHNVWSGDSYSQEQGEPGWALRTSQKCVMNIIKVMIPTVTYLALDSKTILVAQRPIDISFNR
jgi:hypothetical protein